MKLWDVINQDVKKIEFYAIKKPKYHKESVRYEIKENSSLCLTTFDKNKQLEQLYPLLIKQIKDIFNNQQLEKYSNEFNQEPNLYLDSSIDFNYDLLLEQLCTPGLLEESLSLNYLLVKGIYQNDDLLIWIKLKSPLKLEHGLFVFDKNTYQLNFNQNDIGISNYPQLNFNIEDIAFIKYQEDFYIINKDLYQKYFNLESFYVEKVKELIYRNSKLVLDEYLVTKASAKMIYEYYGSIEDFIEKMAQDKISIENVANMIKHLDLNLQISEEKQIILKTPQDLVDLLLLSSGCLGINSLTNEIFKVKKPNYLIKD